MLAVVGESTVAVPDMAAGTSAAAVLQSDEAAVEATEDGDGQGAHSAPVGRDHRTSRGAGHGGAGATSAIYNADGRVAVRPVGMRNPDGPTYIALRAGGQADVLATARLPTFAGRGICGGQRAQSGPEAARSRPDRTRVRGVNASAADAASHGGPHLKHLRSLLQLRRSAKLKVTNQFPFSSTFEWGSAGRKQQVHAADMYYKSEWFDHVMYRVPSAKKVHFGRAALLVRSIEGALRDLFIVQKLVPAHERADWVLPRLKSQCLQWSMSRRASHPRLAAVHVSDLLRLVHVVSDLGDLCERHGVLMTPAETPRTRRER